MKIDTRTDSTRHFDKILTATTQCLQHNRNNTMFT